MSGEYKRLYRSIDDRMIGGVCGGVGEYLGIDPTIVRLLTAFGAIATGSGIFWIYLLMLFIIPEEPRVRAGAPPAPAAAQSEEE